MKYYCCDCKPLCDECRLPWVLFTVEHVIKWVLYGSEFGKQSVRLDECFPKRGFVTNRGLDQTLQTLFLLKKEEMKAG